MQISCHSRFEGDFDAKNRASKPKYLPLFERTPAAMSQRYTQVGKEALSRAAQSFPKSDSFLSERDSSKVYEKVRWAHEVGQDPPRLFLW